MKRIQYLDILKQAFLMTLKNKFLCFFGLFIFFGSLDFSLNMNLGTMSINDEKLQTTLKFIQNNPEVSFKTVIILITMSVMLFILKVIGMAGVIKSANNIAVYHQSKIRAIFYEIKKYLWKLVALEFIVNLVLFFIAMTLLAPVAYLFILKARVMAYISLAIAAVIFIFVSIVAYYLRRYAYFYIVLADLKIKMALDTAYNLFKKNIKESLLMGCTFFVSAAVFLSAGYILVSLLRIMLGATGLLINYLMLTELSVAIMLALAIIVTIMMVFFLFSWYVAFVQTGWVLFFQQISLDKQKEKDVIEKVESSDNVPTPEVV